MEQFVLAFEKASVAAAKTETSVEKAGCDVAFWLLGVRDGISFGSCVEVFSAGGSTVSPALSAWPPVREGISFASSVEVLDAGHSGAPLGDGGGVGGKSEGWADWEAAF